MGDYLYSWGNHSNIIVTYCEKNNEYAHMYKYNFEMLIILWMITQAYIATLMGIKIIAH